MLSDSTPGAPKPLCQQGLKVSVPVIFAPKNRVRGGAGHPESIGETLSLFENRNGRVQRQGALYAEVIHKRLVS